MSLYTSSNSVIRVTARLSELTPLPNLGDKVKPTQVCITHKSDEVHRKDHPAKSSKYWG